MTHDRHYISYIDKIAESFYFCIHVFPFLPGSIRIRQFGVGNLLTRLTIIFDIFYIYIWSKNTSFVPSLFGSVSILPTLFYTPINPDFRIF